jgi:hypothetical protein
MAINPVLAATLGLAALGLTACGTNTSSAARPTGVTPAAQSNISFGSPQAASPRVPSKGEGEGTGRGGMAGGSTGAMR